MFLKLVILEVKSIAFISMRIVIKLSLIFSLTVIISFKIFMERALHSLFKQKFTGAIK